MQLGLLRSSLGRRLVWALREWYASKSSKRWRPDVVKYACARDDEYDNKQPDTKSIRLRTAPFPGPANRDVPVDVEPNFGGSAGTAAVQLQNGTSCCLGSAPRLGKGGFENISRNGSLSTRPYAFEYLLQTALFVSLGGLGDERAYETRPRCETMNIGLSCVKRTKTSGCGRGRMLPSCG